MFHLDKEKLQMLVELRTIESLFHLCGKLSMDKGTVSDARDYFEKSTFPSLYMMRKMILTGDFTNDDGTMKSEAKAILKSEADNAVNFLNTKLKAFCEFHGIVLEVSGEISALPCDIYEKIGAEDYHKDAKAFLSGIFTPRLSEIPSLSRLGARLEIKKRLTDYLSDKI